MKSKPAKFCDWYFRFWAKVEFTPGCWIWTGARSGKGYGTFDLDGKTVAAHKIAYRAAFGEAPDGMQVDHYCNTRGCVRPDHLRALNGAENNSRSGSASAVNARKTHCKRGHEFTEENTYRYKYGSRNPCRRCRTCEASRLWENEIPNFCLERKS